MRGQAGIRTVFGVFAALLLFLQFSCERAKKEPVESNAFGQHELLIGLIPEQNIFRQRERYQILGKYLSEKLGIAVNFTSLSRYGNIVERFASEKMDGAFFGSFTYALAHEQIGVEVIARPVNPDGTSTYHGYIFTRKDGSIRTVADMKGKRFAFVEYATSAGYLYPRAYFKKHGINDLHSYLGEVFFAGSHDAAVMAVLDGGAEIGAAKNTIYDQLARENPRIEKELIIISTSGVVPQNGLAVRRDLDPELKSALKKALLDMDKDKQGEDVLRRFGARGFIETHDEDYKYVYALAEQVGIDLKMYRYVNR